MIRPRAAWAVALLAVLPWASMAAEPEAREELAAIRERVAALDLEGALGALSRLLERPGLTEDERADALALRAGAHVAGGELDAAEADYKAILALRPDFVPEPALSSKKSIERLARLQAAMIATVQLDLDPKDARLSIDDRPMAAGTSTLKVLAGDRRLHAERAGFDPLDVPVRAVAGAETLVRLRMVPNARGLLVRTDLPGVSVFVDGTEAGQTAGEPGAAELLVPDVPIGEHTVELRKPCFAKETVSALVNVDLDDRAPKPLARVAMRPAASRIVTAGATYAGELRVDGAVLTRLPADAFTVCPGSRTIEAVASGRVVWSGTIEADESERTLDLSPRPNVALVGDEWPAAWRDFAGLVSLRGRVELEGGRDLSTPAGWKDLALPADTDLAVAVRGAKLPGERPRVWIYGPAMKALAEAEGPPSPDRPHWLGSRLDAVVVGGGANPLVLAVAPGGAAEPAGLSPGDRVLAVEGSEVSDLAQLRARLDAAAPGSRVALRVLGAGGEPRVLSVTVAADPRLVVPDDAIERILRGAWAAAEGAAGGTRAASALANLAVLLEAEGRGAAAAEVWRRAKALDAAAFGVRADYALAADLAAHGKNDEAIALFRRVRSSADAGGDPTLAAASGDRLADLGVAP